MIAEVLIFIPRSGLMIAKSMTRTFRHKSTALCSAPWLLASADDRRSSSRLPQLSWIAAALTVESLNYDCGDGTIC